MLSLQHPDECFSILGRTALVRLKSGLEEDLDVEFPYDIPKKVNGGGGQVEAALE